MNWQASTFVPAVHHFFSTLDNGVNATIKRNYHTKMDELEHSVTEAEAVIWMLHFSGEFKGKKLRRIWDRNFFLCKKNSESVTLEEVEKTFFPNSRNLEKYNLECDAKYKEWAERRDRESSMPIIGMPNRYDFSQNGPKSMAKPKTT